MPASPESNLSTPRDTSQVVANSSKELGGLDKGIASVLRRILSESTAKGVGLKGVLQKILNDSDRWENAFGRSEPVIRSHAKAALEVFGSIANCRSEVFKRSLDMKVKEFALRAYARLLDNMVNKLNLLLLKREDMFVLLAHGAPNIKEAAQGKLNRLNHQIVVQEERCEHALQVLTEFSTALVDAGQRCGDAEEKLGEAIALLHSRLAETVATCFIQEIKLTAGMKEVSVAETSTVWTDEEGNIWYQSGLFHPNSPECQKSAFEMYNVLIASGMTSREAAHIIGHEMGHATADGDKDAWGAFRVRVNPSNPEGDFTGWYQPFGDRKASTVRDILDAVRDPSEDDNKFKALIDDAVRKHGDNVTGVFSWDKEDWVDVWETNPMAYEHYQRVRTEMEDL